MGGQQVCWLDIKGAREQLSTAAMLAGITTDRCLPARVTASAAAAAVAW
jgi:hypothetical protein